MLMLSLAACLASTAPPGVVADSAGGAVRVVVDCDGGGDYRTIAEALAASADGDIIDVSPCTYAERVDFAGHRVTLQASSGPEDTRIVGDGAGPVVTAQSGEGDGTGLSGFTLTGGVEAGYGAAVFVDLSRLSLDNIVIQGNTGAAIVYSHSGDLQLRDVTFTDNVVAAGGASVTLYRGAIDAVGLDLDCGAGAYAMYLGHGSALIDTSDIACPSGTALYWEHATGRLERTRVDGLVVVINEEGHDSDVVTMENDVLRGGEGVYVNNGTAVLRNSVLSGTLTLVGVLEAEVVANVFLDGHCAIDADPSTAAFTPSYNDIWRTDGEGCDGTVWSGVEGNFAADPLFVAEASGDYTLAPGSPCIDAGPADDDYDDIDGSRNDVGAHGGRKPIAGGR